MAAAGEIPDNAGRGPNNVARHLFEGISSPSDIDEDSRTVNSWMLVHDSSNNVVNPVFSTVHDSLLDPCACLQAKMAGCGRRGGG